MRYQKRSLSNNVIARLHCSHASYGALKPSALPFGRMLSNRESARRSRRRKQAHVVVLEAQVAQMAADKAALQAALQATTEQLRGASAEREQLRREVQRLIAKVDLLSQPGEVTNKAAGSHVSSADVGIVPDNGDCSAGLGAAGRFTDLLGAIC